MPIYNILTENPMINYQTLLYHSTEVLCAGQRVLVPLKNKVVVGFVLSEFLEEADFEIKSILEIIDDKSIITDELLQLGQWLKEQTVSPLIRCYQTILPNQYRPKSNYKNVQTIDYVRVNPDVQINLTSHQQAIIDQLADGEMSYHDAIIQFKSSLKTLINKGKILRYPVAKTYRLKQFNPTYQPFELSKEQQTALDKINFNKFQISLLFGTTGSGKTEVYLQACQKVLETKKQVLVLVPEISLTPQMISRFQNRFGLDIGIYHSGLNDQERYEQYQRVLNQEISIVVGTRSSIFLPFTNLGLIILDEEHDTSFKQESTPYYHAREVAIFRAQFYQCPLVLGSATPALESYAKALKGVYQLLELPSRINHTLPEIEIVDMSQDYHKLQAQIVSPRLLSAIKETLDKKQQVMLLLNRRAYSPIVVCEHCLTTLMCPHCDTTLSYHHDSHSYRCHTCNFNVKQPICPNCHHVAQIHKGVGTQRLEEIIQHHFPDIQIGRMDADTTRLKNAHQRILNQFNNHQFDILIGTQMIAKGLDNENVTLVGIINADQGLVHTDFSSSEKTFSLLMQASGRSGRGQYPGKVIVQTTMPNHYAIQYALRQNYVGFFQHEMNYRHKGQYPPYNFLAEIIVSHDNEQKCIQVAQQLLQQLQSSQVSILGPVQLRKVATKYRSRLVLKSHQLNAILSLCHQCDLSQIGTAKVIFNINPMELSS